MEWKTERYDRLIRLEGSATDDLHASVTWVMMSHVAWFYDCPALGSTAIGFRDGSTIEVGGLHGDKLAEALVAP